MSQADENFKKALEELRAENRAGMLESKAKLLCMLSAIAEERQACQNDIVQETVEPDQGSLYRFELALRNGCPLRSVLLGAIVEAQARMHRRISARAAKADAAISALLQEEAQKP